MRKRFLTRCLVLLMTCVALCAAIRVQAHAASTLTISQPDNWEHISKGDAPALKWNAVTGAAGYRITVKDYVTGDYYTQNEWTTSRSYSLADLFEETVDEDDYPTLKIWVGAMQSSGGSVTIAEDIIYVIAAEVPDVTRGSAKNITSNSVTLYMSVDRDYGSAITDSGFYLGTSSTVSSMTKYSFKNYGSFSATEKGEKYLTITGLQPDTKYYYRAYAVNGVGTETTSSQTFYTEEAAASGLTLSAASYSPGWDSTAAKSITVSGVSSYTYEVAYSGISASDMAAYNYQWLTVTKSGNTLTVKPNRPNYAGAARTAAVTVTGGGSSRTLTVTQAACSEATPAIVAKAGTKALANGDNVGQFTNSGKDIFYLNIDASGVRKVTVNLWKKGSAKETLKTDIITDGKARVLDCRQSILTSYLPGEYYVDIFASNSEVANDYWAKRPASIRIYFTVVSESSGGDQNFDQITGTGAERIVQIAESLATKRGGTSKSELKLKDGTAMPSDWCTAFVSYCAEQAGLSGADKLFISDKTTTVDGVKINARMNANPASILHNGKGTVYYFYNSYKNSNNVEWTSSNVAPGKTYDFFMTGLNPTADLNRTQCTPQPGDLIFFKKSSNNAAWAHVGIITKVNNSTGYLEFVDGNNHGNGTWVAGVQGDSTYVNKLKFTNWKNNKLIMAIAHPHYSDDDITEIDPKPQAPTVVEDYAVDYNANGGSGAPERQIGKKGTVITLSTKKPTRSGYTFKGWATSASATAAVYQPGDKYTITGGQTLYAVWKKNTSSTTQTTVKIISQPQSVTVANGVTATVTVKATGDGLSYRWYYKNAGDSAYTYTSSFTGNTYSVVMNAARDGRRVLCKVYDKYGNMVQSSSALLSMQKAAPVKITVQPKSVTVEEGATAKVTLTATGEGLTYKWYFKNAGTSKFSYTSTFTGNSYSTKMDATRDGRQIYCVVTDQYSNSATSNTVTLSMEKKADPVKITVQPKSVTVKEGAAAKVTLTATGEGLTYKWYFKNAGASQFSYTSTFTGNSYSTKMDTTRNGRQVYCVVTDQYGNTATSNTVTLSMEKKAEPVKITVQPKSVTVKEGVTAKVTLTATGEGLTYKWYFKDAASKFSYTSSFKGNSYSVQMNSARAGRQVYCVISDKHGNSVTTNTVTLNMEKVQNTVKIVTQPKSVTVEEGKTAKVTVGATGDGLIYRWYYKDAGKSSYTYTSSFKGNSYSVTMNSARNGRRVLCKVYDKYGNMVQSSSALLKMK